MKKSVALFLSSLVLTSSPVGWVHAQQPPANGNGKNGAVSPDAEATVGDIADPNSQLGQSAAAMEKSLNDNWESKHVPSILEKIRSSKIGTQVGKLFDNYRVDLPIGFTDKTFGATNNILLDAQYEIVVEPNVRPGEQVRRDIYILGLGATKGFDVLADKGIGTSIGGKFQVRLTFSRIFTGPTAKMDAIKALPVSPTKLPLSTNGIKEKVKVGETLRVEILGNMNAGLGAGMTRGAGVAGVGGGFAREALFMLDIYRQSPTLARLRMFGLKNRGTFNINASATITPWTAYRPDASGRVNDFVKDKTAIGAGIGLSKSSDLFHDFPIDTMMLDYLYKFSSPNSTPYQADTAEAAVDEVLKNARSLGYSPLRTLFSVNDDMGKNIKSRAQMSDRLAKADLSLGSEARVRQLFKGSITSKATTLSINAGATSLVGTANQTFTVMKSFVKAEDAEGKENYFMLISSSNNQQAKALAGRMDRMTINDLDVVMKSDANQRIVEMSDIVSSTEIHDKSFKADEMEETRKSLAQTLPASLQTDEVRSFLPQGDQKAGFFRSRFAFGLEAFQTLNGYNQSEISAALYKFLENHPQKVWMNLPKEGKDAPQTGQTFVDYVEHTAALIYQAINSKSPYEQRLIAFNMLIRDPVFQRYLMGQFFTSLLPADQAAKMAAVTLQFSSEATPMKTLNVGKNQVSYVYQNVAFMRSVLNNRSYDLRLETQLSQDGKEILVTPEIKGFNINANQSIQQKN